MCMVYFFVSSLLHICLAQALLTPDLADVVEQLHCVLDTVIAFCAHADTLFVDAHAELSRLDANRRRGEARAAAGQWGDEDGDDDAEAARFDRGTGACLKRMSGRDGGLRERASTVCPGRCDRHSN